MQPAPAGTDSAWWPDGVVRVLEAPARSGFELTAGVATVWLIPITPATTPAIDDGTDRSRVGEPLGVPRDVVALERRAEGRLDLGGGAGRRDREMVLGHGTVAKPWLASQRLALSTWASVGEKRASHCAAVR